MSDELVRVQVQMQADPPRQAPPPGSEAAMQLSRPRRRRTALWFASCLLLVAVTAGPAIAQAPTPFIYVVEPGDTLFSIAQLFGVTVDELAAANGIENQALISVGQRLIIPSLAPEPPATATRPLAPTAPPPSGTPEAPASSDKPVYVVQPGDTLSAIADRFGTTVEAIAAANDIQNPALIEVGQRLFIPTSRPELVPALDGPVRSRVHTVQAGETLPFLAFRYGTTVRALWGANSLDWLGLVQPGQMLKIPVTLAAHSGVPEFPEVLTQPAPVTQGQTLLIEVRASHALSLSAAFLGRDLRFTTERSRYWALTGIDALTPPGSYALSLTAKEPATGDRLTLRETISVTDGGFATYNVVVPEDRQYLLDPDISTAERELVATAFGIRSDGQQWEGAFGIPLAGEPRTTAAFGQRRTYNGGPTTSYHSGEDLGADKGEPVYAPAAGTVVLAEALQVRGKVVIIDHGLGVFTGFWHLSRIDVEAGQPVARGDLVGLVGNSGLSTGPHLHWEMQVNGVPVSPWQWTRTVFP